MSIQKCDSIMFDRNVRMSPKKMAGIGATRISLSSDERYLAFVEVGIEAYVLDSLEKTVVRVAWDRVVDWHIIGDPIAKELIALVERKSTKAA